MQNFSPKRWPHCATRRLWPSLVNDKATPYSNFCQAHVDVSLSSKVMVHVAKFPRGSKGAEMDAVAVHLAKSATQLSGALKGFTARGV